MKIALQCGIFAVGAALIYPLVQIIFAMAIPTGEISVPLGWIGWACIKFAASVVISSLVVALLYRNPTKAKDTAVILSGFFGGLLTMLMFSNAALSKYQGAWLYLEFIAVAFGIPVGYWLGVMKVGRKQILLSKTGDRVR